MQPKLSMAFLPCTAITQSRRRVLRQLCSNPTSSTLPVQYAACTMGLTGSRSNPGFRPKQSLGQNFLRDRNIISRIVSSFVDIQAQNEDTHVIEVGPGTGALTSELFQSFPDMYAIEIDQRAVAHLSQTYPSLSVQHGDVLDTNWLDLSKKLKAPLSVIGNLPYNIVSQILLSLLETPDHCVRFALVMMQREVALRVIAKPRTKDYGILSVVSQLYAKPNVLFDVPPRAFYPVPSVTSSMVHLEFVSHDEFDTKNIVLTKGLRTILKNAFGQRRKVMRNSLRSVCEMQNVELPAKWEDKRAEELLPFEFVTLTKHIFHEQLQRVDTEETTSTTVWR